MIVTTVVATALLLVAQQPGQLTLTNVRTTYGALGVPRVGDKVLPGDQLFLAFDINGMTVDEGGKALYSMTVEVGDGQGKTLFKREPRDLEAVNALGGGSMPAFVELNAGLDQPPGEYTVKVTVTDRASQRSQTLTRKVTVLPKGFGLVRLTTTTDAEGRLARSLFSRGDSLWVNGGLVGFGRDRTNGGQPNVAIELRVLDENGKPTLARPFRGEITRDIPANVQYLPVQFHVSLNRAGKFTVELKATDKTTDKSSTVSFPLHVQAASEAAP